MTAADIPACVQVLRGHQPEHDVDAWLALFQRDVDGPDKHPVVATDGDVVVGYGRTMPFAAEPDSPPNVGPNGYYLLGLVVPVQHRRRGIGTLLTAERLRWLEGRTDAVFFTTMHDNIASQRMHERLGFERVPGDFWLPFSSSEEGEVLYRLQLPAR